MRNFYIFVVIFMIGNAFYGEANAMRCSGKIIDVGDTSYKMLKHCGEPVAMQSDAWGSHQTFIYEMNGREQRILVIDGIIKGGV